MWACAQNQLVMIAQTINWKYEANISVPFFPINEITMCIQLLNISSCLSKACILHEG